MTSRDGYAAYMLVNPTCEYYCFMCGQLRAWCHDGTPVACGNCGSNSIEVGEVGSEKLTKLRGLEVEDV